MASQATPRRFVDRRTTSSRNRWIAAPPTAGSTGPRWKRRCEQPPFWTRPPPLRSSPRASARSVPRAARRPRPRKGPPGDARGSPAGAGARRRHQSVGQRRDIPQPSQGCDNGPERNCRSRTRDRSGCNRGRRWMRSASRGVSARSDRERCARRAAYGRAVLPAAAYRTRPRRTTSRMPGPRWARQRRPSSCGSSPRGCRDPTTWLHRANRSAIPVGGPRGSATWPRC